MHFKLIKENEDGSVTRMTSTGQIYTVSYDSSRAENNKKNKDKYLKGTEDKCVTITLRLYQEELHKEGKALCKIGIRLGYNTETGESESKSWPKYYSLIENGRVCYF